MLPTTKRDIPNSNNPAVRCQRTCNKWPEERKIWSSKWRPTKISIPLLSVYLVKSYSPTSPPQQVPIPKPEMEEWGEGRKDELLGSQTGSQNSDRLIRGEGNSLLPDSHLTRLKSTGLEAARSFGWGRGGAGGKHAVGGLQEGRSVRGWDYEVPQPMADDTEVHCPQLQRPPTPRPLSPARQIHLI